MGWSCRNEAAVVMEAWDIACRGSSGMTNVWHDKGNEYLYELSRTEHLDGAITGTVMKRVPPYDDPDTMRFKRVGSFRIEGDGTVTRVPAFLKKASSHLKFGLGYGSNGRPMFEIV